jgi:S-adenosylmethionine-dependent methyltransferase
MESRESESDRSWNGEFLWNEKLGNVRNLVRQALVTRQLMEHLPEPDMSFEILDMGCGQGTQLLELARRGYHVTGVDISSQLLSQAEEVLASESQAVRSRVQLLQGDLLKLDSVVGRRFDAVLCHGVLMYLP